MSDSERPSLAAEGDESQELRQRIVQLRARCRSYREIAREVGRSHVRVIQILKEEYAAEPSADLEMIRKQEDEKLDVVERRLLDAFEVTSRISERPVDSERPSLGVERLVVDATSTSELSNALTSLRNRRAKLHGIDAPVKVQSVGPVEQAIAANARRIMSELFGQVGPEDAEADGQVGEADAGAAPESAPEE